MALLLRAFIRKRVISLATTITLSAGSFAAAQNHPAVSHVAGAMRMPIAANPPEASSESPFLAENETAMTKMMADMSVDPSGDVDHDFVEMMVPHHQGAIDMARAVLRHGHNEQIRRLAQEIVVTQQQEIAAMRLAVGEAFAAVGGIADAIPAAADAVDRSRCRRFQRRAAHLDVPRFHEYE